MLRITNLSGFGVTSAKPFTNTIILDSFNRANEAPLGNGTWGTATFGGASAQLVSNVAAPTNALNNNGSYWTTTVAANCDVWATISSVPDSGVIISARINNPGASVNGYILEALGGGTQFGFGVWNAGSFSILGSIFNQSFSAGDGFGMRLQGPIITAFYRSGPVGNSWNAIQQVSDTTVLTAGFIGIGFDSDTNGRLDDFGGGSI